MADLSRQLEGFLANALAERSTQAGVVRRHMPRLRRLLQRLRGIIDGSGVMAPGPGRELRIQTLTRAVANAVADEWGTPTLVAMQQELVPFFTRQLEFARDQVIQAGGTLTAPGAAVATPAVVAGAVSNSVISGQTLGYSLQRSIPNLVADRVARYIRFAQPDVASGDVAYGDAVVRVTERNVEATLRSAVHSTGSFAQELIYQVESDPEWFGKDGLVWTAALDSDVCPVCLGLDGKRYPVGSVKIDPHPQCRCYFLPWKHEQDFVQDGKTIVRKREAVGDKGEQYIPVKQTTEKWATDNPNTIRRIFGKRRGDALLSDLRSPDAKVRRSALSRAVRDWQAPQRSAPSS